MAPKGRSVDGAIGLIAFGAVMTGRKADFLLIFFRFDMVVEPWVDEGGWLQPGAIQNCVAWLAA
jgi:hypothetical protein